MGKEIVVRAASARDQAILQAAFEGNLEFLQCQCEDEEIIAAKCTSGCGALHWAAGGDRTEVCKFLFERIGVDTKVTSRTAAGRTPLHYACRNGALAAARLLVQLGANVEQRAKQGVTPFQLAVFQNQLSVMKWLVEDCGVDPAQTNDFTCGAVHWLAIVPAPRSDNLVDAARWLAKQEGVDFHAKQKQGHTSLHKAAWMGHMDLCRYLHEEQGLWDDSPDDAGNFAADLADMAATQRSAEVAKYLRDCCGATRVQSCKILGLECHPFPSERAIKKAFREKVRLVHPDKSCADNTDDFEALHKAYHHLLVEKGHSSQANPSHSLQLMLKVCDETGPKPTDRSDRCFKARLVAVLLEYGEKGVDASNLKKKWNQVWPTVPFPYEPLTTGQKCKMSLSQFVRKEAGDVVEFKTDRKGCLRFYPKHMSRANITASEK